MRRITRIVALGIILSVSTQLNAQLLKGTVKGAKVEEAAVGYSPDGYVINEKCIELEVGEDGKFVFDMPLETPYADVGIDIPGVGYFGAHLVKGKTVEMTIVKTVSGVDVEFRGPEKDINEWVCQDKTSFDSMKYWSPDPSEAKTNEEYRALLESEYEKVKKLTPIIKDKAMREYYSRLAECEYKWTKIRIIMDAAQEKAEDYRSYPEFKELIKDIDINDQINYQTNLSLTALNNMVKTPEDDKNLDYCMEQMELVDKIVTNENLKKAMVQMVGMKYFSYGKGQTESDDNIFIPRFKEFAKTKGVDVEEMVTQYLERKISEKKTATGKAAPEITLQARDGKNVQLLSVVKGKFTYIDVWATWCGPCCAEIPHLEKLVEKFKDCPDVQFISISTDRNRVAWEKKLEKDNPQWAQFILTKENDKIFSKDWGITGIPRFIMIDADGNIFDADATRPSDPKTEETIRQNMKQ